MALEATHIRFAIDLKNHFQAEDEGLLVSGTIYPDSRYPNNIDRNLTHDEECLKESFYKRDDFKKGWAIHLICDKVQSNIFYDLFKSEFEKFSEAIGPGNKHWVFKTALKILQDIDDVKQFAVNDYLSKLDPNLRPNGESKEQMEYYHQVLKDMYKTGESSIDAAIKMWIAFGLDKGLANDLRVQAEELNTDDLIWERIKKVYKRMLESWQLSSN